MNFFIMQIWPVHVHVLDLCIERMRKTHATCTFIAVSAKEILQNLRLEMSDGVATDEQKLSKKYICGDIFYCPVFDSSHPVP